uniref:Transmembrane protein n=1 Tax=Fagus sylvatica TaxID=28930 RepID=A0A2N9H544_FAGSY
MEFCWFVVADGGVLLNFLWAFVGLWWLVVGLLLILWWVLWWVTMALPMGVLSGGCGCCVWWLWLRLKLVWLLVIADGQL